MQWGPMSLVVSLLACLPACLPALPCPALPCPWPDPCLTWRLASQDLRPRVLVARITTALVILVVLVVLVALEITHETRLPRLGGSWCLNLCLVLVMLVWDAVKISLGWQGKAGQGKARQGQTGASQAASRQAGKRASSAQTGVSLMDGTAVQLLISTQSCAMVLSKQ